MENQTKKLFKNPITIHIWVASIFLVLGITAGVLLFFYEDQRFYGMSATIIMSTVAIAFSYYQFFFNKIDTERRRKYDLKYQAIINFNREGRDLMEIFNYYRCQEKVDIDNLLVQTVNKINRLKISTELSIDLLFKEIKNKEEFKCYNESLDKIVIQTGLLKDRDVKLKKAAKDWDSHIKIWNTNMGKLIESFYDCEKNLYEVFKKYL